MDAGAERKKRGDAPLLICTPRRLSLSLSWRLARNIFFPSAPSHPRRPPRRYRELAGETGAVITENHLLPGGLEEN